MYSLLCYNFVYGAATAKELISWWNDFSFILLGQKSKAYCSPKIIRNKKQLHQKIKCYSTQGPAILRDLRHRVSDRLPLVLELKFLIPPTRQPSNANRGHTRRNLEHTPVERAKINNLSNI